MPMTVSVMDLFLIPSTSAHALSLSVGGIISCWPIFPTTVVTRLRAVHTRMHAACRCLASSYESPRAKPLIMQLHSIMVIYCYLPIRSICTILTSESMYAIMFGKFRCPH